MSRSRGPGKKNSGGETEELTFSNTLKMTDFSRKEVMIEFGYLKNSNFQIVTHDSRHRTSEPTIGMHHM
jgi:hypothetical protein